jgi:hypothetical protein
MAITFSVYDRTLMKKTIIGSYDLDITSVYFTYQHEMYRVWMTLTDPTDTREGT